MTEKLPGQVLVVDDQGVSRMLICHYLEEGGFSPKAVTSCEDALYEINSGNYDIVLLDILMPGMGGLELLRILRSRFSLTELPILMVTSLTDTYDKVRALEWGANDYIGKPVNAQEAIARVRIHLNLHRCDKQLRESEERYALAVRGANEGLWDWNLKANSIYYSPRFISILEPYEDRQISPKPQEWMDRIHPEDRKRVIIEIQEHLRGRIPYFESQHRILQPDNTHRWVLARGLAILNEAGEPVRMAGSLSDISHSLTYDNITGLPSKHIFHNLLERSLARVLRFEEQLFALLVVSIDNFPEIRDSLGSSDSDRLLGTTSRRLQLASRASDIIARLSTSVFGIILDDINDTSNAIRVANRIRESLAMPTILSDQQVSLTASIGIAVSLSKYDSPESMLSDAEAAAEAAQKAGGDQARMFDPVMQSQATESLGIENNLREALSRQQFVLDYHPIIDCVNDVVLGFEPLLRWQRTPEKLVFPAEFLPQCENSNLMVSIGYWVIRSAVERLSRWRSLNPSHQELYLTINLSESQLLDQDLEPTLARLVKEFGLEPNLIKFEFSGDLVSRKLETLKQRLLSLKNFGVSFGINNFGKCRCSLMDLLQLPIDYLKIDISLVAEALVKQEHMNVLKGILAAAKPMNVTCIACGVENEQPAAVMAAAGFELQQGFRYTDPVSPNTIERILQRRLTSQVATA